MDFQVPKSLRDLERDHVIGVLTLVKCNISAAARILGLSRAGLYSKMRVHGIRKVKGSPPENVT